MKRRRHTFEERRAINAQFEEKARLALGFAQQSPSTISSVYDDFSSFPIYFKQVIPAIAAAVANECFAHDMKRKFKRSQQQLEVAFDAGDQDVWK
eukprot:g14193.t1